MADREAPSITTSSLIVGLRQLVSIPANAVALGATSRLLGPGDFAAQAWTLPVLSLALAAIDLGTSQALLLRSTAPQRDLIQHLQRAKLVSTVVVCIALALVSPRLCAAFHMPQSWSLLFLSCAGVGWLQSQRSLRAVALQRDVQFKRIAVIELAEILAGCTALVVSAYLTRSPWSFIISLAIRYALGATLLRCPHTKMQGGSASTSSTPEPVPGLKALLRFGLPLQGVALLGTVNNFATAAIVNGLAGTTVLGVVQWAIVFAAVPFSIFPPFYALLFALFSNRHRNGTTNTDGVIACALGAAAVCAILGALLLSCFEPIVNTFLTSRWQNAEPIVALLVASNVMGVPISILGSYLSASGHCKAWLTTNLIGTAGICLLAPGLTIFFGGFGFAVGWTMATTIALVSLIFLFRRLLAVRISPAPFVTLSVLMLAASYLGRLCGEMATVWEAGIFFRCSATLVCFVLGTVTLRFTTMRREWATLRRVSSVAVVTFRATSASRMFFSSHPSA